MGGGVLRGGALQEEIMFILFPELLALLPLTPELLQHEAISAIGVTRMFSMTGYAKSLKLAGYATVELCIWVCVYRHMYVSMGLSLD